MPTSFLRLLRRTLPRGTIDPVTTTDGFHRVKNVRITQGVPHGGWFSAREKVQVRLPAVAVNEKHAVNLMIEPSEFAQAQHDPYICYYASKATFWLYRDAVFVDFAKRRQPQVKFLADRLLPSPRRPSRPVKRDSLFDL